MGNELDAGKGQQGSVEHRFEARFLRVRIDTRSEELSLDPFIRRIGLFQDREHARGLAHGDVALGESRQRAAARLDSELRVVEFRGDISFAEDRESAILTPKFAPQLEQFRNARIHEQMMIATRRGRQVRLAQRKSPRDNNQDGKKREREMIRQRP